MHYVLDDPRANEESALCLRRDRLDVVPKLNPDELRRVLSTTGPLLPISAIQADLRDSRWRKCAVEEDNENLEEEGTQEEANFARY